MPHKPQKGQLFTFRDLIKLDLRGRTNKPCDATSLLQMHPDALEEVERVLAKEYGVVGGQVRYIGHGHSALVIAVDGDQIIRISTDMEPKRINSERVLRNHTEMTEVKAKDYYIKIQIAAFPHVTPLGQAIDSGMISEEDAKRKFAELHQAVLGQGYHLADGADMNSAIPRENIGVFDDGELTVIDGGMYAAEARNLNNFDDSSRNYAGEQYKTEQNIPALELEPPLVSKSQLDHMKNRDITMGKFKQSSTSWQNNPFIYRTPSSSREH